MKRIFMQGLSWLCVLGLIGGLVFSAAPVRAANQAPPDPSSTTLPEEYRPRLVAATVPGTPGAAGRTLAAPVLLIMDVLPWDSDSVQTLLDGHSIPYDIAGSAQIPTIDLTDYGAVILLSDQPQAVYNAYAANTTKFEDYVTGGGYLQFHAGSDGWNGGTLGGMSLPGGGVIQISFGSSNYVVEPSHPLALGLPNPFTGSSASHAVFPAPPAGAVVITTEGNVPGGPATLIQYPLGAGLVVASGHTLEFGYDAMQHAGIILENMIQQLVGILTPNVYLSPGTVVGGAKPGEQVVYEFTVFNLTGEADTFDLAVTGNSWPVTLSTSQTGLIPHLAAETMEVTVVVPAEAEPSSFDDATLTVVSTTSPELYQNSASLRTYAFTGNNGYAMGYQPDEIVVIDLELGLVAQKINLAGLGSRPLRAAISPDGAELYVGMSDSGDVLVIDTATMEIVEAIGVGNSPQGITFTPDGAYALVANQGSDDVSVINTTTRLVETSINTGERPMMIAMDPCQPQAYINVRNSEEVYVLDLETLTVVDVISDFVQPKDLAVSPYGHWLYVIEQGTQDVAVVDLNEGVIVDRWPTGGYWVSGIEISPDGSRLYITDGDSGGVHVLDALSGAWLSAIPVDPDKENLWDIEYAPASFGEALYVSAPYSGEVVRVNPTTYAIEDRILVGSDPYGLALFPKTYSCLAGAFLNPTPQILFGSAGDMLVFPLRLSNQTGENQTFNLSLLGAEWQAELSDTSLTLAGSEYADLEVTVTIPAGAVAGDRDALTVQAVSAGGTFTASAELTAAVALPGYVFLPESDQVAIVDVLSHEFTSETISLPVYSYPWRGALSPDGSTLYASLRDLNHVAVIDLSDPAAYTTIPVDIKPHGITFSPDGLRAFVANRESSTVSVIDTTTLAVIDTISLGYGGAQSIATSPCLDKIYVASNWENAITVLDATTLEILGVITNELSDGMWGIVVSPLGDRVYVSNPWDSSVSVIDTDTDSVIATWGLAVSDHLANLDISPDGSKLYVINSVQGYVHVIDTTTGLETSKLFIGNGDEWGMGWDVQFFPWPNAPMAYATSPDIEKVTVIDAENDVVTGAMFFQEYSGPRGLALFPESTFCGELPAATLEQSETAIMAGETVVFTATITAGIPTPDVTWDFGDGTTASDDLVVSHTYTQGGVYTVTLTVENLFGAVELTGTVTVGELPAGSFTQSAEVIKVGETVAFTSTITAGYPPPTLTWDFGDGSPTSSEPNPTHTYTAPGVYAVTLTLTNEHGTVVLAGTVTVQNYMLYMPVILNAGP